MIQHMSQDMGRGILPRTQHMSHDMGWGMVMGRGILPMIQHMTQDKVDLAHNWMSAISILSEKTGK